MPSHRISFDDRRVRAHPEEGHRRLGDVHRIACEAGEVVVNDRFAWVLLTRSEENRSGRFDRFCAPDGKRKGE